MSKWKTVCVGIIIEAVVIGMAFAVKDAAFYCFLALLAFAVAFPFILKSEKFRGLADGCTLITDVIFIAAFGVSFAFGRDAVPLWLSVPVSLFFIVDLFSWNGRRKRKLPQITCPKLSDILICVQLLILVGVVPFVVGCGAFVSISAFVTAAALAVFFYYRLAAKLSVFVRRELRLVPVIDFFVVIDGVSDLLIDKPLPHEIVLSALCLLYCAVDLVRWKTEAGLHVLDVFDE